MAGLDTLIAESLVTTICENLSTTTLRKIQNRLFERYGINLTQAVEDFQKLDSVLREFFGSGAQGLEKQFLKEIITLEQSKSTNQKWLVIKNPSIARLILGSMADEEKRNILDTILNLSTTISPEVVGNYAISQRFPIDKINYLLQHGLLIHDGSVTTSEGRKVDKLIPLFENIQIDLEKNKVILRLEIRNESLSNSSVIQVVGDIGKIVN